MSDSRRPMIAGGLAMVLFALSQSRFAFAQIIPPIPVFDWQRWFEMYLLLRKVDDLTEQIGLVLTKLQDASRLLGGGRLVDDILLGHRHLADDLSSISYRIETVTQQFREVFPDEAAARTMPFADVAAMSELWDREIHHSSLVASRAQTVLSQLERNTHSASTILARSRAVETTEAGQGSELAVLQGVVQMIGVINNDLGVLATTLATTERVNASLAATESSEREVDVEQRRRLLEGYSGSGPSGTRIDERFLR